MAMPPKTLDTRPTFRSMRAHTVTCGDRVGQPLSMTTVWPRSCQASACHWPPRGRGGDSSKQAVAAIRSSPSVESDKYAHLG